MINVNLIGFGMVVLLIAADIILRMRSKEKEKWLMGQQTGGYLFFIPVWIFGIVVVVANTANFFLGKR